ncbi:MAG: hypothetical protein ACREJD_05855 [Phycisphaerales bacterium]
MITENRRRFNFSHLALIAFGVLAGYAASVAIRPAVAGPIFTDDNDMHAVSVTVDSWEQVMFRLWANGSIEKIDLRPMYTNGHTPARWFGWQTLPR